MVATWNVSAVNNNPFEYWTGHDDEFYSQLMVEVERFVETPAERDVPVCQVFTDAQVADLKATMQAEGWPDLDDAEKLWRAELRERRVVSGFLKDQALGAKRLVSMPDRITNTIRVGEKTIYRPTVISHYTGSLATMEEWWQRWKEFMFKADAPRPCDMLTKISRSKYPAVTEEEERLSVPLQMLCLAAFDALMVHIMVTLSPDGRWQAIKNSIEEAIYANKDRVILEILQASAQGAEVICLQETAGAFKDQLLTTMGHLYHVVVPQDLDPKRNQNSMVLLLKARFPGGVREEVTKQAYAELGGMGAPVERGDLVAVTTTDAVGDSFLIASFHGDSNGLGTKPVVSSVARLLERQSAGCRLVFGLDANVYLKRKEGIQEVTDFLQHCDSLGLRTCFDGQPPKECCTTCNARTYLQPQLHKAVRQKDRLERGDVNPKDHVLVLKSQYDRHSVHRDNTSERRYEKDTVFPSLRFPSDHALVLALWQKSAAL